MRIIAGRYKGASLSAKAGIHVRPTTDRIREWIFQVAGPFLPESRFLDLFAGTGGLGIEALSRGSRRAVFVDAYNACLIRENVQSICPDAQTRIFQEDVLKFLSRYRSGSFRFTIIAADPPYGYNGYSRLFSAVFQSPMLLPGGLFILERGKHSAVHLPEPFFPVIREKRFGDTLITLFQKEAT